MDACAYSGWRFDILKLILAVMVVAIHTGIGLVWLRPLLRSAVPLFFIISSFFYFSHPKWETKEALVKYLKRIGCLFAFWALILIIPSAFIGQWFWTGFSFDELFDITIKKILFGGDIFKASWYLSACFIGLPAVWAMARKQKWTLLTLVSIACFCLCYFLSNFWGLCEFSNSWIIDYQPNYTFVIAIPWMSFGVLLTKLDKATPKTLSIAILVVSLLIIYGERWLIHSLGWQRSGDAFDDCYLAMIPFCFGVFSFVSSIKEHRKLNLRALRKTSTIIYCSHGTISILIPTILRNTIGYDMPWGLLLFCATLTCSILLAVIILRLEKKSFLFWMKYSY